MHQGEKAAGGTGAAGRPSGLPGLLAEFPMLPAGYRPGGAHQLVPVGAALEIFDIDGFPGLNQGDEMSRQQQ